MSEISNRPRFRGIPSLTDNVEISIGKKDYKVYLSKLKELLTGTSSTAPLEYRALITQYIGTEPPFEDDLTGSGAGSAFIDTLGGTWSYNTTGQYYYTKTGAFADATKVEVILGVNEKNQGSDVIVGASIVDANTLKITSGVNDAFTSPSIITDADGKLYLQPITIKIHP